MNLFANAGLHRPHRPQAAKFPCIVPQNREYRAGDGFADDCLHRQSQGVDMFVGRELHTLGDAVSALYEIVKKPKAD